MKLYWSPQTRSSLAVWMLEEAGLDYSIEEIDIRSPDRKDSAALRAASPMGKVPALANGDVMLGSSAIFLRQFDMLPDSAPISAYADRCAQRSGYAKAMAIEPDLP